MAKALAIGLVIAMVALAVSFRRQQTLSSDLQSTAAERQELQSNLSALETRVTTLSNQAIASTRVQELGAEQLRELSRLRNEVSQLRQATNELSRALGQSQRDLSVLRLQGPTPSPSASRPNSPTGPIPSFQPGTIAATIENTPIPSSSLPPRPKDPPGLQTIYDHARLGLLPEMKLALETNPEFLALPVGVRGSTLLHTAAYNDHPDITQELLNRGAAINQRNFVGETPLYSGVLRGGKETIELLLKAGADPGLPDNNGLTPLKLANDRKFTEIAELLRKYGAKE